MLSARSLPLSLSLSLSPPPSLPPSLSLCLSLSSVRYIETFHKWAGPAHAPSSPWHNQQLGALGGMAMRSSGGSPAPSVGGFLMDS